MAEVVVILLVLAAVGILTLARGQQAGDRRRRRPGSARDGTLRTDLAAVSWPHQAHLPDARSPTTRADAARAFGRSVPSAALVGFATAPARGGRRRLFAHGARVVGADAGYRHQGPYAALGIATTGLCPTKDRIVEIAVVVLHPDGHAVAEWDTLLDPQGHEVGLVFLHELTTAELDHAPTFAQIARHLLHLAEGCVVVAHNADFVEQFLAEAFARAGMLAPSLPAVCTFRWGQQTFPTRNHRLSTIATHLRLPHRPTASAGEDARTVAAIAARVLAVHGAHLAYPVPPAPVQPAPAGPVPRVRRTDRPAGGPVDPWVAGLLASVSMSAREANDPRAAAYLEALASVLCRGQLVTDEARELARLMARANYAAADIRGLLERLLESLRQAAFASSRQLSSTQLRRLRVIATSVGIPAYFDDLLPPPLPTGPEPGSGSFARPVRKPLPAPPPARAPRCGHCLAVGHYTHACPRLGGRRAGPIDPIDPIGPI